MKGESCQCVNKVYYIRSAGSFFFFFLGRLQCITHVSSSAVMAETAKYNLKRVACADYLQRHKKKILYQQNFRSVKDLHIVQIRQHLPDTSVPVRETDFLCGDCVNRFKALTADSSTCPAPEHTLTHEDASTRVETSGNDVSSESEEASTSQEVFVPKQTAVEELKRYVRCPEVSSLKPPHFIKRKHRSSYAKRKEGEIEHALKRRLRFSLSGVYDTESQPVTSTGSCNTCSDWLHNLKQAFEASELFSERCRLLTLLPKSLDIKEIQHVIPAATCYMIRKSRTYKKNHGVLCGPDPYTRKRVNQKCLEAALDYYTEDEFNFSQPSPNKKDVVHVILDGKK